MVVDLANAFFSILMRRDAQRQFAFTSQCHSDSTFTLAPQGFVTFPALCYSVVSGTLIDRSREKVGVQLVNTQQETGLRATASYSEGPPGHEHSQGRGASPPRVSVFSLLEVLSSL